MRPLLFRWRNLNVWSYPAMLYFGLVAGVVAGNVAAHVAGVDAWHSILTGMIFTRVGCLLNGCSGKPSPGWFAVYLPNEKGIWERRIPTQCFEAMWAAGLLLLGVTIWNRKPFPGALFLTITAGYASGRFVMEFARERAVKANRLTMAHVIARDRCVVLFSSGCLLGEVRFKSASSRKKESG